MDQKDKTIPAPRPQINMEETMKMAQSMAEEMKNSNGNGKPDLKKMMSTVTEGFLSKMDQNGSVDSQKKKEIMEMTQQMMGSFMPMLESMTAEAEEDVSPIEGTKVSITREDNDVLPEKINYFELLDDDEKVRVFNEKWLDDIECKLDNIQLEDVYKGKTIKMKVRRERITRDSKGALKTKQEEVKFQVPVEKGIKSGHKVRFNREGNEKPGYEASDIVVRLEIKPHPKFERSGANLYTVINISLWESYAAAAGLINIVVEGHLSGHNVVLKNDVLGAPLHTRDGARKVKGFGMPTSDGGYGDLYIRFNVILPETFEDTESALKLLERLFPILPDNKSSTIVKGKPHSFTNLVQAQLDEVTEEDMQQLDYDSDESSEEEESDEE